MRIEDATDNDHETVVDLTVARLPHQTRAAAGWAFDEPASITRLVVKLAREDDGTPIGFAMLAGAVFLPARWAMTRVVVDSAWEGRGVGRALAASLEGTWSESTTELRAAVVDDDPRSLAIAEHWGFAVETHGINSELALVDLPLPAPPPGVTLEDASAFEFPDRDAVEAMLRASQTNPEAVTSGQVATLDQLGTPSELATTVAVLVRVDGAPAGILVGFVRDGELEIAYTGIDPAHRGRSLARLVKQEAHLRAAAAGATVVRTSNEAGNLGIRRINADLGYVVQNGVYRLGRKA